MAFDYYHFENNQLPHEVIKSVEILENLNEQLKEIIIEEIKQENKIFDVSTGWPEKDSIVVQMKNTFKNKYEKEGITFTKNKDRHYSKEEYASKEPLHLVVCPF